MNTNDSHYIHGTTSGEQHRLGLMNRILNEASIRELRLAGGEKILDLGSGLGELSRAMARIVGRGRVLAIERSSEQLAAARARAAAAGEADLVDMREGDALALQLGESEWGSFDLAHTRFLLEHLPDPLTAVRAMVRAVRPGGRIVLEDDDHEILRLWPEVPELTAVWQAYMRTYERNGNDPLIGRKLVELLAQAGARPVRNQWIFFGGCSGSELFRVVVENCAGILEGAKGEILADPEMDEKRFDAALDAFRGWSQRPGAAFWFAMAWAEGARPCHPERSEGSPSI